MSLLYMCPITSTVVSEYLRNSSLTCLLIYDDLSKHAISYRHLSLTLLKPVGREAFPSDIFFLHPPVYAFVSRDPFTTDTSVLSFNIF